MQKSYYNNAITGNSSILACFSDKAELLRLFWPNIDYIQHFDKMLLGVFENGRTGSTVWLNDNRCEHCQGYLSDTNIIKNTVTNFFDGYRAVQYDFVHPEMDVLVRRLEIENLHKDSRELAVVSFSAASSSDSEVACSLFDFENEALIHYKPGYYIALTADIPALQFQIGNNANDAAVNTYLYGKDDIGMMKDAAVSWGMGVFQPHETKSFNLYICAADSLKSCKSLLKKVKSVGGHKALQETEQFWKTYLRGTIPLKSGNTILDDLYKRSLLAFRLMYDKKSGGLMAAPEVDEYFTKCGKYGYCWGRDAAFITGALDLAGLSECVDNFYRWAVLVQEENGSWQQRYHMNGDLGPCWGLQIDETGTIIWGMLNHYQHTKNVDFLKSVWGSVKAAAGFLAGFIDEETGLPKPSFDLWEERYGEHAYSSAAVCAGLRSAAEIARILGIPQEVCTGWDNDADRIKQSIVKHFWKEDYRRFIRSVRVKLNGFGQEPSSDTTLITVNPKGYVRDVTKEDWIVDVSLVGLGIPFGIFELNDPMLRDTVSLIEQVLTCQQAGGLKRYENDTYIGGNPWILTTLWVALYHAKAGNHEKAKEYLMWASNGQSDLGFLPEQVNRDTGRPEWIIPLTWSHAMYVHVYKELIIAGVL
ncbi:MAG TPA: glycoside hydrolase family 15 protein [Ruminiclostridium sp.]|nr:glycoside hydrolase family 15 protein [Ruminiclostridium sp.]